MRKFTTLSAFGLILLAALSVPASAAFVQTFDTDGSNSNIPALTVDYPGYVYTSFVNTAPFTTPEPNGILSISGGAATLDFNTPTPVINAVNSANVQFVRTDNDADGIFTASVDVTGDNANGSVGLGLRLGDLNFFVLPGSSNSYFGYTNNNSPLSFIFLDTFASNFVAPGIPVTIAINVSPNAIVGRYDFAITLTQTGMTTRNYSYLSQIGEFNPAAFAIGLTRSGNAPFGGSFDNLTSTSFVPEPATCSLLAIGCVGAMKRRRR